LLLFNHLKTVGSQPSLAWFVLLMDLILCASGGCKTGMHPS